MTQGSDTTKEKLLIAATKLFALNGLTGATTRSITSEAQVNQSAIPIYFETKEALYRRAVIRAIESYNNFLSPVFEEIQQLDKNNMLTQENSWDYIVMLVTYICDWFIGSPNKYEVMLLNREIVFPTLKEEKILYNISMPYRHLEMLLLKASSSEHGKWASAYSIVFLNGLSLTYNSEILNIYVYQDNATDNPEVAATIKASLKRDLLSGLKAVIDNHSIKVSN